MAPLVVDQSDPAVELSDTSSQTTPSRTPQSTPPRNRAASLGSSPWSADPSPLRPTFSLPFSFPMNPLSFLHPSPTNSILSPRAQTRSTTESHLTREARSMTLGCDAPATAAGPSTEQQFFPSAKDYAPLPLTLEDQSAYIKEAMCHLMSMLAFGSQGHSGSRGQAAASFQNVVPHLYQPQAKELRLRSWFSDPPTPPLCSFPLLILFRYLIDLFQFEFRRVYRSVRLPPSLPPCHFSWTLRIANVCPLERLIQYGIFSSKTNRCSVRVSRSQRSILEEDAEATRSLSTAPAGNAIMTALRILQQGLARPTSQEDRALVVLPLNHLTVISRVLLLLPCIKTPSPISPVPLALLPGKSLPLTCRHPPDRARG
jgi:hypothetical protein